MTQDTTRGNFGGRTLCTKDQAVREASLQSILDNSAVFQELWNGILGGKVDSKVRGQVIVSNAKAKFYYFFFLEYNWDERDIAL